MDELKDKGKASGSSLQKAWAWAWALVRDRRGFGGNPPQVGSGLWVVWEEHGALVWSLADRVSTCLFPSRDGPDSLYSP